MAFPYWKCKKCGSTNVKVKEKPKSEDASDRLIGIVKCQDCGNEWEDFLY